MLTGKDKVKNTPLARGKGSDSKPRNAKKVLFAAATSKDRKEVGLDEVIVAGKVGNKDNRIQAEDSLDILPGFSQVEIK